MGEDAERKLGVCRESSVASKNVSSHKTLFLDYGLPGTYENDVERPTPSVTRASLVPQRLDRVQPRRRSRWIKAEENSHCHREHDRGDNCHRRNQHRPSKELRDQK